MSFRKILDKYTFNINRDQDEKDKKFVISLVREYLEEKRTLNSLGKYPYAEIPKLRAFVKDLLEDLE